MGENAEYIAAGRRLIADHAGDTVVALGVLTAALAVVLRQARGITDEELVRLAGNMTQAWLERLPQPVNNVIPFPVRVAHRARKPDPMQGVACAD